MSKMNNAAQAAMQEELARSAREWAMQRGTVENFPATARTHIRNLADALLPKLRAPVADPRAVRIPVPFSVDTTHKNQAFVTLDFYDEALRKEFVRAVCSGGFRVPTDALASAPVAAPSDETLRLAGVIADKIEDGTLFQAGIFSRRELADKVRAVVRFVGAASAPVAGEALVWRASWPGGRRPTDWRDFATNPPPSAEDLARAGYTIQVAYAAPQASAEDVRNAALEALEAAQQFIRNGIELGYIRMPDADTPDPAHRTPGLIDTAIHTLKNSGGEVDDREAWAADMRAAGAKHLGGECWEWDVDDFEFRLWQVAARRTHRTAHAAIAKATPKDLP